MAQFDESKVINTLHPEKAEVGKKYWYADNVAKLKYYVEQDRSNKLGELRYIDIEDNLFDISSGPGSGYWYLLYPYEEPPKKRMTNKQLTEWLAKGNGEYSRDSYERAYVEYFYYKSKRDNEVDSDIKICPWGSEEWVEPTVDIYERDCKGVTGREEGIIQYLRHLQGRNKGGTNEQSL